MSTSQSEPERDTLPRWTRRTSSLMRAFLGQLFPSMHEVTSSDAFRLSGKLNVILLTLIYSTTLFWWLGPRIDNVDYDVLRRVYVVNAPLMTGAILIGLIVWRRTMSLASYRRLTYASIVLVVTSLHLTSWPIGNLTTLMGLHFTLLVSYRVYYDVAIGRFAMLFDLGMLWLAVLLQTTGVVEPQAALMVRDTMYRSSEAQVGALLTVSIELLTVYVMTNWTVLRLRHREAAMRVLREALALREGGRVGRQTGRVLDGKYTLGSLLGHGGMGEVYAATEDQSGRQVAVKLLHAFLLEDSRVRARFEMEARIAGALASKNCVKVLDVGHDTEPYLVLELLVGEDLESMLARERRLQLATVVELVAQCTKGLEAAHAAHIVHRDLKPANLFLHREGGAASEGRWTVKILDFGVCKVLDHTAALTQDYTVLGTPYFMSPEQARGASNQTDQRSDVFSLATIAHLALTGEPPFDAPSPPLVLIQVCEYEPHPLSEFRSDLPQAVLACLEEVFRIALAKRKEQRYASVAEFGRDFASAARGLSDANRSARASAVVRARPPKPRSVAPGAESGALAQASASTFDMEHKGPGSF